MDGRIADLARRHGEKVALAGSSILLAGYLAASALFSGAPLEAQTLERSNDSVIGALSETHPDLAPSAGRSIRPPDGSVSAAGSLDAWTGNYRTVPEVRLIPVDAEVERAPALPGVRIEAAKAEPGRILLRFDVHGPDPERFVEIAVASFVIERRKGTEPWSVIATLPGPGSREAVDATVEALTRYGYRIRAVGAAGTPEGRWSPEFGADSADIWRLRLEQAVAAPDDPEAFLLYIRVERHLPGRGWVGMVRNYRVGDRLGSRDGRFDQVIALSGDRVAVNLDCGWTIRGAEEAKRDDRTQVGVTIVHRDGRKRTLWPGGSAD